RHARRDVREHQIAPAEVSDQAIAGGEIHSSLPLLRGHTILKTRNRKLVGVAHELDHRCIEALVARPSATTHAGGGSLSFRTSTTHRAAIMLGRSSPSRVEAPECGCAITFGSDASSCVTD